MPRAAGDVASVGKESTARESRSSRILFMLRLLRLSGASSEPGRFGGASPTYRRGPDSQTAKPPPHPPHRSPLKLLPRQRRLANPTASPSRPRPEGAAWPHHSHPHG